MCLNFFFGLVPGLRREVAQTSFRHLQRRGHAHRPLRGLPGGRVTAAAVADRTDRREREGHHLQDTRTSRQTRPG